MSTPATVPISFSNPFPSPQPSPSGFAHSSRPKNGFKGTNSTFIRSSDGLPVQHATIKGWQGEGGDGREVLFGFYTKERTVIWVELGGKSKDQLAKFQFSTYPTALSINAHTSSSERIDLLIGFQTGDILWMDPMISKYTRLNKGGMITSSPITSLHWLPGTDNHFLSTHMDGTLLIWDKDRDDTTTFSPSSTSPTAISLSPKPTAIHSAVQVGGTSDEEGVREPIVTRMGAQAADKKQILLAMKCNPLSHWKISKKPILNAAFAPDRHRLATVGEDGCLRIFDIATEKLLDSYASYFGGLTTVCWSPSGRFLVTGGQDDLLTIYAPSEQRLVARCPGHSSFVSAIAFDPYRCDEDERTLRFASVSEDCKVIFWDLNNAALQRPKLQHHAVSRRYSGHSTLSLTLTRRRTTESTTHLPLHHHHEAKEPTYHPSLRRDTTNTLLPTLVKQISNDLLVSLFFHQNFLLTLSRAGQIKLWSRPSTSSADVERPLPPQAKPAVMEAPMLQRRNTERGRDAGHSLGLMQRTSVVDSVA
ncbi:WD40 repeat-like protein [Atractiella rhizophila]|nr:WD40 repeat-like protein [Atractiella rhizophila]